LPILLIGEFAGRLTEGWVLESIVLDQPANEPKSVEVNLVRRLTEHLKRAVVTCRPAHRRALRLGSRRLPEQT
jgi:hypothetical protein